MTQAPDKQAAHRILTMLRARLVSSRHLSPWAATQIEALAAPPAWLCELVSLTYVGDVDKCLAEFVHGPPFEEFDLDSSCDYHVACLFVRYEQGAISWATFLDESGRFVDGPQAGSADCEWYFAFLNTLEDAEYDETVTSRQVAEVRGLLGDSIARATADFGPFAAAFRKAAAQRRQKS